MAKDIILSGIQPTGELHIGNYLGALKHMVEIQDQYQCYYFLATYHSLSIEYDVNEKRQLILNLAKAYLATGIDPKNAVVFDQSDVPAHFELSWIFNCLTPLAEAERMTQYKDKSEKNSKNINLGLLTYPVLQAADILLYHATKIPIGADQVQHVELTRKIARWFNNRFGEYFIEPQPVLTKIPKVMSLSHPEKKMSKSDGPAGCILLTDDAETIIKKIRKAVTGTGVEDIIPAGAENLLSIVDELGRPDVKEKYLKDIKAKKVRYGDMKEEVAQIIIENLNPIRERYLEITDAEAEKVLKAGAEKANREAEKTMEKVRRLIGVK